MVGSALRPAVEAPVETAQLAPEGPKHGHVADWALYLQVGAHAQLCG